MKPSRIVREPKVHSFCWVAKRIYSGNRAPTPSYSSCSKLHREGKLTCAHHDKWETEAQELKARS